MKKLSEMKIAKDAILSSIEAAAKGGFIQTGPGTTYTGPSNPTHITTYVDGMYWGEDGFDGFLFGDWWHIDKPIGMEGPGKFLIDSNIVAQ